MKIKLLTAFLIWVCVFENNVFAQKENNIWYFGNNAGVDFNSGSPVALTNGMVVTYEGNSTISDANGNLLFYTDGTTVWDSTHTPMPNGNSLQGHNSSTQSALIVPFPNNPASYYIFTISVIGTGLCYSVVDMSLNNGKGDVTVKNFFLIGSVFEKLTAVRHINNTDVWVMVHGVTNNNFYCFLVSSAGVSITPIVSSTGTVLAQPDVIGYMKFSPDGTKIALAAYFNYYVDLFDFDPATGLVNNEKYLTLPLPSNNGVYGLEFSGNGNYLYASLFIPRLIMQWDISSNNASTINSTIQQVGSSSAQWLGALQLAHDGKIYVAEHNTSFLGVINYPDSSGSACNYVDNAVSLSGKICQIGLPNFITSYFLSTGISNLQLPTSNFQISPNPATDKIYISFPAIPITIGIKIYSITGEVVFEEKNKNTFNKTIDVTGLSNGIYFLSVLTGREIVTRKIVINQ
jgi:type IX secretion system substrate protein